jgi:two-component system phosphate regulon sensor histidine kinase PhoR
MDEPVGRHYLEVVRQRAVGELLEAVLATGARREGEVQMLRGGRAYAMIGVPFPGPEGQPPGAVLTFHDVTERHAVERVRRDFVANASHELRTPLTSIRGFVEALEDGAMAEPATGRRFLEKIRVHADRMAGLVSDLLDLSRLESGERAPSWQPVSPAEVAEEVAAAFADSAERKGVALRRADHGSVRVVSDPDRLRQIVENLVENAVKYTPPGGRIDITTGPSADGAEGVVADDGPGIPAEHLPRIFERFYRVDKARSREMGGTGLGLSIVKHLAESIGAVIRVESRLEHGTRFTVSLPGERERRVE